MSDVLHVKAPQAACPAQVSGICHDTSAGCSHVTCESACGGRECLERAPRTRRVASCGEHCRGAKLLSFRRRQEVAASALPPGARRATVQPVRAQQSGSCASRLPGGAAHAPPDAPSASGAGRRLAASVTAGHAARGLCPARARASPGPTRPARRSRESRAQVTASPTLSLPPPAPPAARLSSPLSFACPFRRARKSWCSRTSLSELRRRERSASVGRHSRATRCHSCWKCVWGQFTAFRTAATSLVFPFFLHVFKVSLYH